MYIDFKANPQLIRSSLEDLALFTGERFAEKFYSLLEWLNGPQSLLESNDCAFRGGMDNTTDEQFPHERKCQGRLMILFRDIAENCQPRSIEWLMNQLMDSIQSINPVFRAGAIGFSRMKTIYMELGDRPRTGGKGEQLMVSFYAYGKNDRRCYESMEKIIEYTHSALERINRKIKSGEVSALYG